MDNGELLLPSPEKQLQPFFYGGIWAFVKKKKHRNVMTQFLLFERCDSVHVRARSTLLSVSPGIHGGQWSSFFLAVPFFRGVD